MENATLINVPSEQEAVSDTEMQTLRISEEDLVERAPRLPIDEAACPVGGWLAAGY